MTGFSPLPKLARADVGGIEFPLATEKPGSGGAVDADELAPLGG